MSLQVQKDRLDPPAHRGKARAAAILVTTFGANHRCAKCTDRVFKLGSGVSLVTENRLATSQSALHHFKRNLSFATLGRGQRECPGRAVGRKQRVQAKAPEEARVRCAPAVVGGVG